MDLKENIPLAPYTTLKIGGPARYFARVTSEPELLEAVRFARARNLPLFTLGGGSNLVVPDEGYSGLILKIAIPESIEINQTDAVVSAGTDWDALVLHLCQREIAGMECLAGIPGLVGGAPIQNIGAYGQEVSQTIASVRALDLESMSFVELSNADCGFAYRTSIFNSTQRNRYIVTQVTFRLDRDAKPNLSYADLRRYFAADAQPSPLEVYAAVHQIRAGKGMLIDPAHPSPDTRSAGSFFKNPIVSPATFAALGPPPGDIPHWPQPSGELKLAAAWLIEHAGFGKGFALGPVGISTKHTLALVNKSGTAQCADLLQLRDHLASGVAAKFGIALEQEPVMLA